MFFSRLLALLTFALLGVTITADEAQSLLTREEAAKFLGMSIHTFKRVLSRHEIEVVRVSGRPRFRQAALIDWLERNVEPPLKPRNGKAKSS